MGKSEELSNFLYDLDPVQIGTKKHKLYEEYKDEAEELIKIEYKNYDDLVSKVHMTFCVSFILPISVSNAEIIAQKIVAIHEGISL